MSGNPDNINKTESIRTNANGFCFAVTPKQEIVLYNAPFCTIPADLFESDTARAIFHLQYPLISDKWELKSVQSMNAVFIYTTGDKLEYPANQKGRIIPSVYLYANMYANRSGKWMVAEFRCGILNIIAGQDGKLLIAISRNVSDSFDALYSLSSIIAQTALGEAPVILAGDYKNIEANLRRLHRNIEYI